ncbi:MAG: hypothetical protein HPY66_2197 [Firmicutes bacterium]|nr:hypothetical protein [Bacillota bacterium]
MKILVIAGTIDARQIIEALLRLDANITATTATGLGRSLLNRYEGVDVREGRLDKGEMAELMDEIGPHCLIDASHPFAREVSCNAIEACKIASVPYLRYERPKTEVAGEGILLAGDFEEAVDRLCSCPGNILLTIGSKNLDVFTRVPDYQKRLFVRVLPDSRVLEKCEGLGLNAQNILAVKGPFSEEMNMAMLKYCDASVMVTKDSGSQGGNKEKISACRKLGIPVMMIERPRMDYGLKASSVAEVVDFVKSLRERGDQP